MKRQHRSPRKTKAKTATDKQAYPHDSFFKKIFKRPKYLMQLLRIIFPPKFIAALDAASLNITDGTLLKRAGGGVAGE